MATLKSAFKDACTAAERGDYDKAATLFRWLNENPTLGDISSEMFRRANGFLAWAMLAAKYPPALVDIRSALQRKQELIATGSAPEHIVADCRALESALASADIN